MTKVEWKLKLRADGTYFVEEKCANCAKFDPDPDCKMALIHEYCGRYDLWAPILECREFERK